MQSNKIKYKRMQTNECKQTNANKPMQTNQCKQINVNKQMQTNKQTNKQIQANKQTNTNNYNDLIAPYDLSTAIFFNLSHPSAFMIYVPQLKFEVWSLMSLIVLIPIMF